ncbi:MAG TPA: MFS transporter, partial [Gammaproteobacteria bacterium]|nr:MFS transporter [Gammaproteobacteria bacterium]
FILPFFLFSALAGQLADKFEKSVLIRRIKIAEIVIMCLAATGFTLGNMSLLMFVLFLMGSQSTLFGPLKYGILPQHLQESELTGGNGMIQMGTYVAILLGTIIGGVLIAIKPGGPYLVSALVITVAASGWLSSRLIPRAPAPEPDLKINWNVVQATWWIMGFAHENRKVFWSIIAVSWCWFYGATLLSLIPSYTRDVLAGNELIATLLLTAFSVGIGTGSLLCEKLSGGHIETGLMPIGAAGLSLCALDLFITGQPIAPATSAELVTAGQFLSDSSGWRILLDICLLGGFGGIYIVPLYALIQNLSSHARRARIIAANNILNALFMVFSALLTISLISMSIGIPVIFLIVSVLNILMLVLLIARVPEFWSRCVELLRLKNPGRQS